MSSTPNSEVIAEFMAQAAGATDRRLPDTAATACIGSDEAMVTQIYALIESGEKTGTFTLPWLAEHGRASEPHVGDLIVLVDVGGLPKLLVQIKAVEVVPFGMISERHTALDGPAIRAVELWKSIHTTYWNPQLAPFGLEVKAAMPVWVQQFECVYAPADG